MTFSSASLSQSPATNFTGQARETVFVNSMSDLFHKDVPLDYIRRVFDVMKRAHWHRFQVLTKRAERLAELSPELEWAPNIWMGVSVETDKYRGRIDELRSTDARTKLLSLEPVLGPLPGLDLRGIDWVIVGGESGPRARPMDPDWVTDIRDQCSRAKVPFFFKQWGGTNKKKAGRLLEGQTWDQMPPEPGQAPKPRRPAGTAGGHHKAPAPSLHDDFDTGVRLVVPAKPTFLRHRGAVWLAHAVPCGPGSGSAAHVRTRDW
jgi:protein gp37